MVRPYSFAVQNVPFPEQLFYTVIDPQNTLGDRPIPACTTLLHRICYGDDVKFQEAVRIIGLFINAAYEKGKEDANSS